MLGASLGGEIEDRSPAILCSHLAPMPFESCRHVPFESCRHVGQPGSTSVAATGSFVGESVLMALCAKACTLATATAFSSAAAARASAADARSFTKSAPGETFSTAAGGGFSGDGFGANLGEPFGGLRKEKELRRYTFSAAR